MKKYQNRYRIESHRKPGWDYANAGEYFIAICIDQMQCILGEVVNEEMVLSEFGFFIPTLSGPSDSDRFS